MFKLLKSSLRKRADKGDLIYQSLTLPSRSTEPFLATPLRSKSVHSLRSNGVTLDEELMDWVYDREKSEDQTIESMSDMRKLKRRPRRSSFPPPMFKGGTLEEGSVGVLFVRVHQLQYRGRKSYEVKYRLKVASRESASINLSVSQQAKDSYATFPEEILLFEVDRSFSIHLELIALRETGTSSAGLIRKLNKRDQFPAKISSLNLSFPLANLTKTTETYILNCDNELEIKSAEAILTIGVYIVNQRQSSPTKESPSNLADSIIYEDLLTIYTRTGSYMSKWVQYYGVLKSGMLHLYEESNRKKLVSIIPLTHLLDVNTRDPHLDIGYFELAFNKSAFESPSELDDEELPPICKVYLMADDQISLQKWVFHFQETQKSTSPHYINHFISNKYLMTM
ncbi:hypothetical protein K7432_013439 [Basidiobolus ranarum]|uniref:PH domain-containing protein n=1 Tax=Basidiobolus ranarum TaxID=34480 RepID=A0ABR2VQU2_9FUNG